MWSIKNAIDHLCKNIIEGGQRGGWTALELETLCEGVLKLAKAAEMLRAQPTWQEAAKVISQLCATHQYCADCPACEMCGTEYPGAWDLSKLGDGAK